MDELRHEIANMPPITKFYAASCLFLSIAVHLGILSPLQLYFNPSLVFGELQVFCSYRHCFPLAVEADYMFLLFWTH
ncbi:Derlin-2 [Sparganum proliferum]